MDVWATAAASDSYKAVVKEGKTLGWPPARRAVDLAFNHIQPKNGIIELRFVGESVKGIPTEAILQALEVGQGNGGEGATAVSVAPMFLSQYLGSDRRCGGGPRRSRPSS